MVIKTLFGMGAAILILISFATAYNDTFLSNEEVKMLGTESREVTPEDIKRVQRILGTILILLGTLCVVTAILISQQNKRGKET